MPFYLEPMSDKADTMAELQICIAEALYDAESVLVDPGAYSDYQLRRLRDQIVFNLERAWEITGSSEDQLRGTMIQISLVVAREFEVDRPQ